MQVAAADALRGLKLFEKLDVPIIGVIENMSGEFFGTGAGEKLAADYDVPYLGTIPLEPQIRIGGDTGKPIVVSHPEAAAAQALKATARDVAARVSMLTISNQEGAFIPIQMIG